MGSRGIRGRGRRGRCAERSEKPCHRFWHGRARQEPDRAVPPRCRARRRRRGRVPVAFFGRSRVLRSALARRLVIAAAALLVLLGVAAGTAWWLASRQATLEWLIAEA